MMMTTETLEKMTVGYVVHGLNDSKVIAFIRKEYFSINYRSYGSGMVNKGLVLDHQGFLSFQSHLVYSKGTL